MPKILISYRRSDTLAVSGRIFDRLATHYGKGNIFLDIDNIPFGVDFRDHVNDALLNCDVMLAVIGPGWAGDKRKGQGIWAPNDWVRIEVEAALQRKIALVPVLVEGAKMPVPSSLPESLADLSYRNAIEVDIGRDFHAHVERLIKSMDERFAGRVTTLAPARATPAAPPSARTSRAIARPRLPSLRRLRGLSPRSLAIVAGLTALVIAAQSYLLSLEIDAVQAAADAVLTGDVSVKRAAPKNP